MSQDPFELLGLGRDATLDEIRAARRRLAFDRHPDRGGSAEAMRDLNSAFDAAVGSVTGRRPLPAAETVVVADGADVVDDVVVVVAAVPRRTVGRAQHDVPSFVIDALPAEAFEALLIVTSWIGEVLVDDPPYVLEVHLLEPSPCWCRLDLVPDAGASTVSLTVVAIDDRPAPLLDDVRDTWVANLNRPGAFP